MSKETCGHGESDKSLMALVESFIIYVNHMIVIPRYQFEGKPVKPDNGVRRSILASHQQNLGTHVFLLLFMEREIEVIEPSFSKCKVLQSFPGIWTDY